MLLPRDVCGYDSFNRYTCRRTVWEDWVRWVVLAVVVIGAFLLFVACSCITARRRRRAGRQPFYGTGWAAGRTNNAQYNAQPYYANTTNSTPYQAPAPPYSPPQYNQNQPGPYYGANQSYYSGTPQQNGVELNNQPPMAPPAAYSRGPGGEDTYQPPPNPPPAKA